MQPENLMNRRQFLCYAATLTATATASMLGYRYLSRPPSLTLNKVGLPLAHLLRDGELNTLPSREHVCETLILGSGAAALCAAWTLVKNGYRNILLADGFERNGNNAAYAFSGSLNAPSGAHYLALPSAESTHMLELLGDLGILQGFDALGKPVYRETDLVFAPEERLFRDGNWQYGLAPENDGDTRRFFQLIGQLKQARGSDGRKIFAIPIALSSQDKLWRQLDSLTFAQWLWRERYRSPRLLWYLDYCCRDDYGQGIEQVSAFAGLHYFAARGNEHATVLTWQDGLNHISEGIRAFCGMQAIKSLPENGELVFARPTSYAAVATRVLETADGVEVVLRDVVSGDTRLVRAKNVICAMPLFVVKRVLAQPEKYGFDVFRLPEYAPWLVSNFVLRGFPKERLHSELAWDNVVYGSRGLGYVVATNQQINVAKPERTIFTAYSALNHDTPANVRRELLQAQPQDLLGYAAQDLLAVYGKGFWQFVEHVDMTVRAHAMAVPKVGYLADDLLLKLRGHDSQIVFAHGDLSGYSVFEEAAWWGVQAAKRVLLARGQIVL